MSARDLPISRPSCSWVSAASWRSDRTSSASRKRRTYGLIILAPHGARCTVRSFGLSQIMEHPKYWTVTPTMQADPEEATGSWNPDSSYLLLGTSDECQP